MMATALDQTPEDQPTKLIGQDAVSANFERISGRYHLQQHCADTRLLEALTANDPSVDRYWALIDSRTMNSGSKLSNPDIEASEAWPRRSSDLSHSDWLDHAETFSEVYKRGLRETLTLTRFNQNRPVSEQVSDCPELRERISKNNALYDHIKAAKRPGAFSKKIADLEQVKVVDDSREGQASPVAILWGGKSGDYHLRPFLLVSSEQGAKLREEGYAWFDQVTKGPTRPFARSLLASMAKQQLESIQFGHYEDDRPDNTGELTPEGPSEWTDIVYTWFRSNGDWARGSAASAGLHMAPTHRLTSDGAPELEEGAMPSNVPRQG